MPRHCASAPIPEWSAGSHFDLRRKYLDLIIGSHHETTNFFALDVPVQVSGQFDDPDIAPAKWSEEGRAKIANANSQCRTPAAFPGGLRTAQPLLLGQPAMTGLCALEFNRPEWYGS